MKKIRQKLKRTETRTKGKFPKINKKSFSSKNNRPGSKTQYYYSKNYRKHATTKSALKVIHTELAPNQSILNLKSLNIPGKFTSNNTQSQSHKENNKVPQYLSISNIRDDSQDNDISGQKTRIRKKGELFLKENEALSYNSTKRLKARLRHMQDTKNLRNKELKKASFA